MQTVHVGSPCDVAPHVGQFRGLIAKWNALPSGRDWPATFGVLAPGFLIDAGSWFPRACASELCYSVAQGRPVSVGGADGDWLNQGTRLYRSDGRSPRVRDGLCCSSTPMEGHMPASTAYTMRHSASAVITGACLAVCAPMSASANVITDWDQKAIAAVEPLTSVPSPATPYGGYRMMGMVHAAMFDAVNSIERRYRRSWRRSMQRRRMT